MRKALRVGATAGRLGYEVGRVKAVMTNAVNDAIEDGVHAAERAAKKGRYAAEDFADETACRIKQNPFCATGITLGVGVGLGLVAGWLATRRCKEGESRPGREGRRPGGNRLRSRHRETPIISRA